MRPDENKYCKCCLTCKHSYYSRDDLLRCDMTNCFVEIDAYCACWDHETWLTLDDFKEEE